MSLNGDTLNLILAAGGFLVGLFALWLTLFGYGGYKVRLKEELAIRLDAAKALTAPKPKDMYLDALEGALNTLTSWMGKRASLRLENGRRGEWSKSANWCFTLAMIYPFVFLLTSWLLGGTGAIGDVKFLPASETLQGWQRVPLVLLLFSLAIGFLPVFHRWSQLEDLADAWLDKLLWQKFPKAHRNQVQVILPLAAGTFTFTLSQTIDLSLVLSVFLALSVSLAGTMAIGMFGLAALCSGLAVSIAGSQVTLAVFVAILTALVTSTGAMSVASGITGLSVIIMIFGLGGSFDESVSENTLSATLLLFFLLLPFVNALFDWVSWQVSRWLGDSLLMISQQRDYPRWKRIVHYVKDIVIDVGFALLCLIGLAWAIPRIINAFSSLVQWLSGHPLIAVGDYLCAAATEPLGEGLWATSMLFSTLLPTAAHFSFLIFAPVFWGISWLFGAHLTNRARASHLTQGSRPPKQDIRGDGSAIAKWPRAMQTDFGLQGLHEDQAMFEGQLNPTTLHAITMQLRVWRPLYYTAAFATVVFVIITYAPPLIAIATGPLPEFLLWIANNFDWTAVHQGCPALNAPPTPPFSLPWS